MDVARGYARNYLLPRQLAEVATPARVAELERVEAQRARHEAQERRAGAGDRRGARQDRAHASRSSPARPGSLFGSVTSTDIVDELWRTRKIRVDRRKVGIDPIKRIGRYAIPIEVFEDVEVEVKTLVVPEGGELPPEEELAAIEAAEAAEAAAEAEHEAEHEEAEAAIAEVIAEEEPEDEPRPRTSRPSRSAERAVPDERPRTPSEPRAELEDQPA